MLFSSVTICLVLASSAFAQTTTISLYIPGADTQPLVGSVVTSDATATTYLLQCANTDVCGFDGPFTLTEGPATAVYTISSPIGAADFIGYDQCSLGFSSAICVESNGGSEANSPGSSTVTYSGTDFTYMPVTITSGSVASAASTSAISAVASTTKNASAGTASKTSGSSSATATTSNSGAASTPSSTSTSSGTKATSTSTAGGAVHTGSVGWIIGGAAVVVGALV